MRIIYTLALIIGAPVAFAVCAFLMVTVDDWMTHRFGKPPLWLGIISAALILWPLVMLAWEQAGKWVN